MAVLGQLCAICLSVAPSIRGVTERGARRINHAILASLLQGRSVDPARARNVENDPTLRVNPGLMCVATYICVVVFMFCMSTPAGRQLSAQ
jgi:hypothetical protein